MLQKVQEVQCEILAQSFPGDSSRFYVDFIKLETLQVCSFPGPDKDDPIVFIGLTSFLVDELLSLTASLAQSADVQILVGTPASLAGGAAAALFTLALQFIVSHEVGHYVLGHIVDRAMHFEYSGAGLPPVPPLHHAEELEADQYGIVALCCNLMGDDSAPAMIDILPPGGTYETDQFVALLAISITAVFLLYLNQTRSAIDLAKDQHPPQVYRLHRTFQILQHWLTQRGKSTTAVTGDGLRAIMDTVIEAFPADLRLRWNAQADLLASPAGQAYQRTLDDLLGEEV